MREMFRTLRPGGVAVVMVPLVHGVEETDEDAAIDTPELRWRYYGAGDHVRQYGKADFVKRLTETGFRVDRLGVADIRRGRVRICRHRAEIRSCMSRISRAAS